MKRSQLVALAATACLFSAVGTLKATTIYYTSGATSPSFVNGATPNLSAYNNAVSLLGVSAPFNGFIGDDVEGGDFDATWTHANPVTSGIVAATLQLGIYDHDSAGATQPVLAFTLNSIDLTPDLNSLFIASGGANNEYNIYTLTLPSSVFSDLLLGSTSFQLTLQGPGLGAGGFTTDFNGAGLNFATLGITTQDTSDVPEPATASLLILGLAGLGFVRLRRRRV
jgi:hypothetical protein